MPKPNETKKPDKAIEQDNPGQDLYDIFVAQGIKIASEIAPRLEGKASIDTLGNALADTINKIETEGARHGIKFPLEVLLHGSNEILGYMIDVSGVQADEAQIKGMIGVAVGNYVQNAIKTGKMTKEQIVQLAQQAAGAGQQVAPQTGGMQNG